MTRKQRQKTHNRNDANSMLGALRTTTAIGAVSLTLAGWGVLSHAEAINAAQVAAEAPVGIDEIALGVPAQSTSLDFTAGQPSSAGASAASIPTTTQIVPKASGGVSMPTTTPEPRPSATPTEAAKSVVAKVKLDVVQWAQTTTGDVVAVVRDGGGTLWYVWEEDVSRIEQGLSPTHQPIPVRRQGRTRGS